METLMLFILWAGRDRDEAGGWGSDGSGERGLVQASGVAGILGRNEMSVDIEKEWNRLCIYFILIHS